MSKIKYIALNRAEGPTPECFAIIFSKDPDIHVLDYNHFEKAVFVLVPDVVQAAKARLQIWARTAPKMSEIGYDKCDFEIGWENGKVYAGRFDMISDGESLWRSLARRLGCYSLRSRPGHFKDNHWAHFKAVQVANGFDRDCAEILDTCEIPY